MTNTDIKLLMKILTNEGVPVDTVVHAFRKLEEDKHELKLSYIDQQAARYG